MDIQHLADEFNGRHDRTSIVRMDRVVGKIRVELEGELDLSGSTHLGPALESMLQTLSPGNRMVLDLSGIRYISSTGVGVLTTTLLSAKRKDILLSLERLQPKVEGILKMLGLLDFFAQESRNE